MEPSQTASCKTPQEIDCSDPQFEALRGFAGRIDTQLKALIACREPNLEGVLDAFIGAVYALTLAKHYNFKDRTTGEIQLDKVQIRTAALAGGKIRLEGAWLAGFHFDSALFRLAAVYHRLLKIVVGRLTASENLPELRGEVRCLYRGWKTAEWSRTNLDSVHNEVNALKHKPKGHHAKRTVTYKMAVSAVGELLDLIEVWAADSASKAAKV